MSEEKDYTSLIASGAAAFTVFVGALLRYWKDIVSIFKKDKEKEVQSVQSLLTEVQELKKTVDEQAVKIAYQLKHIEKIEAILLEFGAILESFRVLKSHKSLKFVESITVSLGFTESLRPEYEDNLYSFLEEVEKAIRQVPLSGKKISLNFLGTRAFNSDANTAIAKFFSKISHEDLIRLKVLFPKSSNEEKLSKNLNSLRSTSGNDNVQVVVIDERHP
jgi:hypothetical protein